MATFVDICFSLPRSIAEKRTQKIAGTRSSKFVFYVVNIILGSSNVNKEKMPDRARLKLLIVSTDIGKNLAKTFAF